MYNEVRVNESTLDISPGETEGRGGGGAVANPPISHDQYSGCALFVPITLHFYLLILNMIEVVLCVLKSLPLLPPKKGNMKGMAELMWL